MRLARRHLTWAAFTLGLAVTLAAVGWVTLAALRLDRAQAEAQRIAEREENIRLALWRMDSKAASLVAQEAARPYFHYSSFYPAERAYTRMFAELKRGEILMPSPLLVGPPPYVLLHFQFGPDGALTSPQVAYAQQRPQPKGLPMTPGGIAAAQRRMDDLRSRVSRETLLSLLPEESPPALQEPPPLLLAQQEDAQAQQTAKNVVEQQARNYNINPRGGQQMRNEALFLPSPGVVEGALKPVWSNGCLLLVRRVATEDGVYVQGCRLDWPALREWLLSGVRDILPQADLAELQGGAPAVEQRGLVTLPVRLVPGEAQEQPLPLLSPVRASVLIAWGCVLAVAVAAAVLLGATLSLSERRAAFTSAVTHELRSPLTTFRMYTEMLTESMVGEGQRRQYLDTLREEAERLSHLVANVLAYSRLDGRSAALDRTTAPLGAVIERVRDRLARRAEQAGMELEVDLPEPVGSAGVSVDPGAVEQILFNLVDNACKYAASAADRCIHIESGRRDGKAFLRVRDHGPGVAEADARHLFQPFRRMARGPQKSAPGVGLGLALSRRLARSMGGDLILEPGSPDGASFLLVLRRVGD